MFSLFRKVKLRKIHVSHGSHSLDIVGVGCPQSASLEHCLYIYCNRLCVTTQVFFFLFVTKIKHI